MVRLVVTSGSLTRRPKRSLRCLLVAVPWQIGSLTRRPKRSLRCLLVAVPWQINEYLSLTFSIGKWFRVALIIPIQLMGSTIDLHRWRKLIRVPRVREFKSCAGQIWQKLQTVRHHFNIYTSNSCSCLVAAMLYCGDGSR